MLSGRKALVTGAARGIGKGIALEFAKNGCDVFVADIDLPPLEKTVAEITALGRDCGCLKVDVSSEDDMRSLVEKTVARFGRLDILAHAAGILRSCSVAEQDAADWDRVVAVNLRSSFLLAKYAGARMMSQKYGKMVFIDSCASKTGEAFNAVYCASKAGVRLLAHSLALELAEHNINVNSIAPGTIDTDMIRSCLQGAAVRSHLRGVSPPVQRIHPPETHGHPRGGGQARRLPRLRQRRLHHRRLDEHLRRPRSALRMC